MDPGLRVLVDGVVFQLQSRGGISRLYSEILPRVCELDSSLHVELLRTGTALQELPRHGRISYRVLPCAEAYLRPGRVFRPIVPMVQRLLVQLYVGTGSGCIWHSTYYSLPGRWDGWQVVTIVDMIHERFPELFGEAGDDRFRNRKRRCISQADAVICISKTTREDVIDYYGISADLAAVVPLACSSVFRPLDETGLSARARVPEPFLLYVGARSHHKNFGELARAYSVWRRRGEVSLVAVGASWSADEWTLLTDLGIAERVHLLANVRDDDLCRLYNRASAFVYPSLYEGFGIPLLEAMACGCPIVASRIPSTVEVAAECPLYFRLGEAESLLFALDTAVAEGRSSARVHAGTRRAERYSWDETAMGTLEVYRGVSQRQ